METKRDTSKAGKGQMGVGTSTPSGAPDQPAPKHPWTPEQVKEALGYAPDDPYVFVEFRTATGLNGGITNLFGFTATVNKPETEEVKEGYWDDVYSNKAIEVLSEVRDELEAAVRVHSAHEGWAIIKEELDELWNGYRENARKEAIQVAAMAIRYIIDLHPVGGED